MKKLIFFILLMIGVISLQGMETDSEIQKQEQGEVNQIINYITEKISWLFGPKQIELEEFPEEILVNIILQMPGGNFTETIKAIKALSQTNRIFNRLVNDPKTFEALLNALSEKYNINPILVTAAFGTQLAKELLDEIRSKSKETEVLILEKSIGESGLDLEDYFGIIRGFVKWRELVWTKYVDRTLKAALYKKCPENVEEQKKCHEYINGKLYSIFGRIREEEWEELQPLYPRFRRIDIDYDN
ncbi:MAG: hypothetical protein WDZ41_04640 [Candidatus Babeliales bacterium]